MLPRDGRQLEFPIVNSQALVLGSWRHSQFGDRQAGEEVVCLGESRNDSGNSGGQSGHGRKDGAQVSPAGASAPSELTPGSRWRTREDCFQEVWGEVQSLLEVNPGLEAKTVLEYLQRRYAGRFPDGQLRTLQRRVKVWRFDGGFRLSRRRCSLWCVLCSLGQCKNRHAGANKETKTQKSLHQPLLPLVHQERRRSSWSKQ